MTAGDKHTHDLNEWDLRYLEGSWPTQPDRWLVELASDLIPGTALDIGSGPGRNSLFLARRGWKVTAIDSSRIALKQLSEAALKEGLDVSVVFADFNEAEFGNGAFDLVVVSFIHLLPELLAKLLKKATAALKEGGLLYVCLHSSKDLGKAGPPDPERLYSPEKLAALTQGLKLMILDERQREGEEGLLLHDVVMVAEG